MFPHIILVAFMTAGAFVASIAIWHLVRHHGRAVEAFRAALTVGARRHLQPLLDEHQATDSRTKYATSVPNAATKYRRDDGIGPAVIASLADQMPPGVRPTVSDGEPVRMLTTWADAPLAVVVDAVLCTPSTPGAIHRSELDELQPRTRAASSHSLGVPDALRLAQVLERAPRRLVVYAVEAADVGFGVELSAPVADALPHVVRAVSRSFGSDGPCRSGSPAPSRASDRCRRSG